MSVYIGHFGQIGQIGPKFASPSLDKVEQDRRGRVRRSLRCPRCGGNLFLDWTLGGHIADLKCLACGRSPGEIGAVELTERYGIPASDLDGPAQPYLWVGED